MTQPAPTVSVLMITYNHGPFIRQAVESVLAQKTNFPIEIVIGEDSSTDDTPAILCQLATEFPGLIRLKLRDQNIGANLNFADTLARCRGEFIACLEGDDFWLGTEKLQRQVEFLRTHSDCALCFHDAAILNTAEPDQATLNYCVPKPREYMTLEDLLSLNPLPTCSVVFRRALLSTLPNELLPLPMLDWPIWALLARAGRLAYLDKVWSSYRCHAGGIWSTLNNEKKLRNGIRFYRTMYGVLGRAHHSAIARGEKPLLDNLVGLLVHEGRWRDARAPAKRYLSLAPGKFRAPPGRASLYWRLVLGWPSSTMLARIQKSS